MESEPQAFIQSPSSDVLDTGHLQKDLKGRSIRGGIITVTSQGTQFVLQTISTIVLARLLTPADFGMVAMVTSVIGIAHYFADVGLSEATIQRPKISQDQVSALFWINVAVGVGLTCIAASLAPAMAWLYGEPRLSGITLLTSLGFTINGLRVQHDALLKRQMRFKSLAIRDVSGAAAGVLVGVVMAMRGNGYWAVAATPLAINFTQMVGSWFMVQWRPCRPFRRVQIGSMLAFGGNVAASYLTTYFNRSSGHVLIGWYWGAGPLGLYSRAYNLLMLPFRHLNAPLGSVAMTAFSRIQDDQERYARYYLKTANLMMWLSAPLIGFLVLTADAVIVVVLGDQWRDSAPVFRLLAISALAQQMMDTVRWLFLSQGRSAELLRVGLYITPVIVGSYAVGLPFGIDGVAFTSSIGLLAILPWIFHLAFRGTTLTVSRLWDAIARPVATTVIAMIVTGGILYVAAPTGNLSRMIVSASGFTLAYLVLAIAPTIREELSSLRQLFAMLSFGRAN